MHDEIDKMEDGEKVMELTISYEEKGRKEGKKEVAVEMLKKGFSIEFTAEVTKLEEDEIRMLKERI
ncbi:transposase [Virgibacillus doumboii]|uniref:transposase n=1 Tax=Virgibacillus doumboii TaxID=2697503 RepID=UPI0031B613C3